MELAELEKQLSLTCQTINELLDESRLVNNFECCAAVNDGTYKYKDRHNRMLDMSMGSAVDLDEPVDFDSQISPLVEEKKQAYFDQFQEQQSHMNELRDQITAKSLKRD